ncbi:MAG: hypothetical protein H7329_20770 [Opitutaceae bacterium]|nr:hypothetical protein [Cytophagales bacterium]
MNKKYSLILAFASALSIFSCSKKHDQVAPGNVKSAPTMTNEEFSAKMQRLAENVKPVFVKTSANTATFTSGKQSGTIYYSGNTTKVVFTNGGPAAKYTIVAPVFKTTGVSVYKPGSTSGSSGSGFISGAQQTIVIELNASNVDQFSALLNSKNLFGSLFDSTTSKSISSPNNPEFIFAPKLNTDSLPSGALSFITLPTISVIGDASSLSNSNMSGFQTTNAKLLSISNKAGIFELQQDSVVFSEIAPGFNMLFGGFTGGEKLVYNGTTYEGGLLNDSNKKAVFANFLFGFGTGDGNKVSGIQIGFGIDAQAQKAVMLIGVFGDIVVPN